MLFRVTALALACIITAPARADDCTVAAQAAERAFELPPHLLETIGMVETGRRAASGQTEAWPWSVNAAGQGHYLNDPAQAIAMVTSLRAMGVKLIDVGCFQMNLFHHPDAFRNLDEAFDPAQNAMAAGRFLRQLRDSTATWEEAVARYHSSNPELGRPYMQAVWARWQGTAPALLPILSRVAAAVMVIIPGARITDLPRTGGQRLPLVITPHRSPSGISR